MNEFTKEELELLDSALSNYSYSDPLRDKIQSMIDNYCEHEGIYYECTRYGVRKKVRCNHKFENNTCKYCNTKFIDGVHNITKEVTHE